MGSNVTETQLWVDNTEPLYRMKQAIWKNLLKKCRKGIFNEDRAKQAFWYLTTAAARSYKSEFKDATLTVADRREAEQDFVNEFKGASGCRMNHVLSAEREAKFRHDEGLSGVKRGKRARRCGCGR